MSGARNLDDAICIINNALGQFLKLLKRTFSENVHNFEKTHINWNLDLICYVLVYFKAH